MKREQFEAMLVADNWEKDRFGHYQKTERKTIPHVDHPEGIIRERKYRVKMQDLSCRIELQVRYEATEYSPAKNERVRAPVDIGLEAFLAYLTLRLRRELTQAAR